MPNMFKFKKSSNPIAFLFSKHPDYYWKQMLTYMSLLVVVVFVGGRFMARTSAEYWMQEGFEQQKDFVLELQESTYDPFYAEIYEQIHPVSKETVEQVIEYIEKETQPSKDRSTFLDVGCGTGKVLKQFYEKGYKVAGIEQSSAMVDECNATCNSQVAVQHKNVLVSSRIYEEDDFSHILCLGPTTLYEICSPTSSFLGKQTSSTCHANLNTFLKHVHKWLRRGGYFVVQIQPLSSMSQSWVRNAGGKPSYSMKFPKHIRHPDPQSTEIHFSEVDYTLEMTPPVPSFASTQSQGSVIGYDDEKEIVYHPEDQHRLQSIRKPFSSIVIENSREPPTETVVLKETFTNRRRNHVRQNEWHLTSPFSDTQDWVEAIQKHGFALSKAAAIPYPSYEVSVTTTTQTPIPQIYLFQKI